MVVKGVLDLLLVFVNYTEPESGTVTPVKGGASPQRDSPDGIPSNSMLFKDAVEIYSEEKGAHSVCVCVCVCVCVSVCVCVCTHARS